MHTGMVQFVLFYQPNQENRTSKQSRIMKFLHQPVAWLFEYYIYISKMGVRREVEILQHRPEIVVP
jgi:hypothetical protein